MYKKIAIFSPGRSGSTLLHNSLCTHSQIRDMLVGEILCHFTDDFSYYHSFIKNNITEDIPNIMSIELRDLLSKPKYLDHVFLNEDIIKVLYDHIYYPFDLLEYIKNRYDILVINLSRKNLLLQYESHIFNMLKWQQIDKRSLTDIINKNILYERIIDTIFSRRIIKIYYEDLIAYWNDYITQIEQMMNIDVIPIKKLTTKNSNNNSYNENIRPNIVNSLQPTYTKYIIS